MFKFPSLVAAASFLLGFGCLSPISLTLEAASLEFHVAPAGKPEAIGTAQEPFHDLLSARDAIRKLSPEKRCQGVTVFLADGLYPMPDGILLDASDSGTKESPIVYTAEPNAHPILLGGHPISGEQLEAVKDRSLLERLDPSTKDHIRQIDLAKLGIGKIPPFPLVSSEKWRPLQVVHAGVTLPLSRWPNGEYGFTTMQSVTDNGDATHGGTFVYRGDHPSRWINAMKDGGVWLRGFWRVPWVINGVQVKEINTTNSTITLMKDVGGGIGSKYKKDASGKRCGDGTEAWYAMNLPEEIDEPGEWAIDFKRQLLLIWPPEGVNEAHPIVIADNTNPIVTLQDASNVILKRLNFTGSLAPAISINGGTNNQILGCTISNIGTTGILIRGGTHHLIVSNDIRETGLGALDVTGGNKATLEQSGHEILNNDISRAANDYPVGALIVGQGCGNNERKDTVGIHVAHNRIHDTVNAGVWFGGADNLFELNEVYRVGLNSGDLGGFYGTSGFTGFGNVIRNNFVHHSMNGNAFYVDDGYSGATIEGNIVYKTAMGVLMGGGHYNRFEYNIVIDSPRGLHVDSRGVDRKYTLTDHRLGGDIALVPYDKSTWKERHPELAELVASGESTIPRGDTLIGNLLINCEKPIDLSGKAGTLDRITVTNNLFATDSVTISSVTNMVGSNVVVTSVSVTNTPMTNFADPENFNFSLKPDSKFISDIKNFPTIPFDQIGLQVDEYRVTIPERNMKLLREGDTRKRSFSSTTDIDASNKK